MEVFQQILMCLEPWYWIVAEVTATDISRSILTFIMVSS